MAYMGKTDATYLLKVALETVLGKLTSPNLTGGKRRLSLQMSAKLGKTRNKKQTGGRLPRRFSK